MVATYVKHPTIETNKCLHLTNNLKHYWPIKFESEFVETQFLAVSKMNDENIMQFGNTTFISDMFDDANQFKRYYDIICRQDNKSDSNFQIPNVKTKIISKNKSKDNFDQRQKEKLSECLQLIYKNSYGTFNDILFLYKSLPLNRCQIIQIR